MTESNVFFRKFSEIFCCFDNSFASLILYFHNKTHIKKMRLYKLQLSVYPLVNWSLPRYFNSNSSRFKIAFVLQSGCIYRSLKCFKEMFYFYSNFNDIFIIWWLEILYICIYESFHCNVKDSTSYKANLFNSIDIKLIHVLARIYFVKLSWAISMRNFKNSNYCNKNFIIVWNA